MRARHHGYIDAIDYLQQHLRSSGSEMALIYVHFEYRTESQTDPIKEIVNRVSAIRNIITLKSNSNLNNFCRV